MNDNLGHSSTRALRNKALEAFRLHQQSGIPDSVNFKVVCLATKSTAGLERLADSCKQQQVELVVVGEGLEYLGFCMKMILLYEYLKRETNPEDIILFSDAYDVILNRNKRDILDTFQQLAAPMVISGELNCWPRAVLKNLYPETPDPYCFVNAGSHIGYSGYQQSVIHSIAPSVHAPDDQLLLSAYYLAHKSTVKLDTKAEIIQNLYKMRPDDYRIVNGHFQNQLTGSSPALIHGNGDLGLKLLSQVEKELTGKTYPAYNVPRTRDQIAAVFYDSSRYAEFWASQHPVDPSGTNPLVYLYFMLKRRKYLHIFLYANLYDIWNSVLAFPFAHHFANFILLPLQFAMKLFPALHPGIQKWCERQSKGRLIRKIKLAILRRISGQL